MIIEHATMTMMTRAEIRTELGWSDDMDPFPSPEPRLDPRPSL